MLWFLVFSGGLQLFAIGPITPLIILDHGMSKGAAGALTSVVFLVHALFAIPASLLIGRVNLKLLITCGAIATTVPVLTFAAADNYLLLLILRAVHGLGFILIFPASGPLFMQWFSPRQLSFVTGGLVLSASVGVAISAIIVAPLSEAVGWELVLSGFGAISLLSAVSWVLFGRARPIEAITDTASLVQRVWKILHARTTLLIAVADSGPLVLLTVSLAWLPTFFQDSHGYSLTMGGTLMGILSFGGVLGLIAATLLTARLGNTRVVFVVPGVISGFAGLAVLLVSIPVGLYLVVFAIGFACWVYVPALMTLPMKLYPDDPRRVSLIFSTLMTTGGFASFVAPPAVGYVADYTGTLVPGLAICATLGWGLAIAGWWLPQSKAEEKGVEV